jgi:hypothetical protein
VSELRVGIDPLIEFFGAQNVTNPVRLLRLDGRDQDKLLPTNVVPVAAVL